MSKSNPNVTAKDLKEGTFDPEDMNSVLFFHGLESGPYGTKYRALCEHYNVFSPDFQGMDIWERLEKAEDLTRGMENIVVVGSSYGGLLASLLYEKHPERFKGYVLMAPALHRKAANEVKSMSDNAVVIHGTKDTVVPLEKVESFCEDKGVSVTRVEDNHRLHKSLDKMLEGVRHVKSKHNA